MIGSIKNAIVRFFQPVTSSQYFTGIRQFNKGNYRKAAEALYLIRKGVYNTSILYSRLTDFYYHRSLRNRSLIDFYNGDFLQCIINCKKALEVNPEDQVSLNYLAHSFHHVGQYSAAIRNLQQLLVLEPDRLDVQVNLAKVLVKADRLRQAVEILDELIEENDQFADFFLIRGIAYAKLSQSDEAIANYKQAIKINRGLGKGLLLLGLEYIRDFQYEAAHEVFAHGVEVCSDEPELLFYYGLVGNIIRSIKDSNILNEPEQIDVMSDQLPDSLLNDLTYLDDRAVTERLNNLDLDISYGEHFTFLDPIYDKPCLERLIHVFKDLIVRNPDYADYKYKLATFFLKLGDLDNAKAYLQEALLINPGYLDALQALMGIYENESEYEEADTISTKILALAPNIASHHLNHGRIMLKMERYDEATGSMLTAARIDDRFNSHLYLLGFILSEHGEYALARSTWKQIVDEFPALHRELRKLDKLEQQANVA